MYKIVIVLVMFLISCSTATPFIGGSDVDNKVIDNDVVFVDDGNIADNDISVIDNPQSENDVVVPDNDNGITTCKTDTECGTGKICISAKCENGCASDTDCKSYTGTRCNTKLGRCLNIAATSQACGEAKCNSGCCYTDAGYTILTCLKTADIKVCGLCKQGEIYSDGKTCIPAACNSSTDKCSSYNSTKANAKCYQCKAGELICYENTTTCKTGSGMIIDALSCVPAGENCNVKSLCCSGQPCISGYCY